ncbi:uncharacterized protein LOC142996075 [Genypterus blacodes]|uniref:uncharacterized protein LOC142996075 n=1 Tax=Genypterus blacodes TaxID=154954 RepID=UPI003F76FA01
MISAVGPEVAGLGLLTSGFIILFLLCILLTALCTDCTRHSFDLQYPEIEIFPSAIISVKKLGETAVARENPMIHQIQNDKKEFSDEDYPGWITPWRNHVGELQRQSPLDEHTNGREELKQTGSVTTDTGFNHEDDNSSGWFTPWRRHLEAPQSHSLNGVSHNKDPAISHPHHSSADSPHLFCLSDAVDSSPHSLQSLQFSQRQGEEPNWSERSWNPMYARISKKVSSPPPTLFPPPEAEGGREETPPPLPERMVMQEMKDGGGIRTTEDEKKHEMKGEAPKKKSEKRKDEG